MSTTRNTQSKARTTTKATTGRAARRPAAPRTVATPEQVTAERQQPKAFVVPTSIMVDALKTIGSLPISNESAKGLYEQLRRCPTLEAALEQIEVEKGSSAAD